MERSKRFHVMGELKLDGMKAAFDEVMATAVKLQHEPQRIVGDLLSAEINEKQARGAKLSGCGRRCASLLAPPSGVATHGIVATSSTCVDRKRSPHGVRRINEWLS